MKLHIVTIGQPKLSYAKIGWEEYVRRLSHYHQLHITHIGDKHNDAGHITEAIGSAYSIVLVIEGSQLSSPMLAKALERWSLLGRELCFVIGGPDGLPSEVIERADSTWSLGPLTFPHDLAMVITLEALYRAATISAGQPYHK